MAIVKRMNQNWLPDVWNHFFDDDFGFGRMTTAPTPAINVIEGDKEYKVELSAPGMTKEDLKLRINEDDQLVISMEKKNEQKEEKKNEKYLRREFSYSSFEQAFTLPDEVDKEKISAGMENGVLTIDLPKFEVVPEAKKERMIEIQ